MYRRTLSQWRAGSHLHCCQQSRCLSAHAAVLTKHQSATESVQQCLQRIKERDGQLGSFITVDEQGALKQMRTCNQK